MFASAIPQHLASAYPLRDVSSWLAPSVFWFLSLQCLVKCTQIDLSDPMDAKTRKEKDNDWVLLT